MFSILIQKSMDPFYQTITSFPTIVYTALLLFCLLYWIVAVLGMVEVDFLDLDIDGDIDIKEGIDAQHALAGLLLKLGLHGVPLTIILTILSIVAWLLCYYASLFSSKLLPGGIVQFAAGIPILLVATYLAAIITGQIIKPIRTLFSKLDVDETKHIIGQSAIVRSGIVDKDRGEATMSDGGAGLLLNIRATGDELFHKGDEVVIIEKIGDQNTYRVIAKSEFNGE